MEEFIHNVLNLEHNKNIVYTYNKNLRNLINQGELNDIRRKNNGS